MHYDGNSQRANYNRGPAHRQYKRNTPQENGETELLFAHHDKNWQRYCQKSSQYIRVGERRIGPKHLLPLDNHPRNAGSCRMKCSFANEPQGAPDGMLQCKLRDCKKGRIDNRYTKCIRNERQFGARMRHIPGEPRKLKNFQPLVCGNKRARGHKDICRRKQNNQKDRSVPRAGDAERNQSQTNKNIREIYRGRKVIHPPS